MAITIDIQLEVRNQPVHEAFNNTWVVVDQHPIDVDLVRNQPVHEAYNNPWVVVDQHPIDVDLVRNQPVHAWAVAAEIEPEIGSEPEPSSDPYVVENLLNPAPGAVDVGVAGPYLLVVGDAISTMEVPTIEIGRVPTTAPDPIIGIDPDKTAISVSINGGSPVDIFSGGIPHAGWSVVSAVNDYAGVNRGIQGVGRNYTLTPGVSLPGNALVEMLVELVDYGNNYSYYVWTFRTEAPSIAKIKEIFVISEDLLQIEFTQDLAVIDSYFDLTSFSITPLGGAADVFIEGVLTPIGAKTPYLFLKIKGLRFGSQYQFNVSFQKLHSSDGSWVAPQSGAWLMRRTKVDSMRASLARFYDTRSRGLIRGLIEAIMISDEKIGGDF